jgi:hypothetical protein
MADKPLVIYKLPAGDKTLVINKLPV